MIKIREAKITDVPEIYRLINYYADKREMLHRALTELYEGIQGFFVAERGNSIIGCCSLSVTWDNLAEIKSLAVKETCKNNKIGKKLVEKCHERARKLNINRIFVLTYVPGYFKKLGYKKISKNKLPHKVWSECVRCPYFPDCKEVPLLKNIH